MPAPRDSHVRLTIAQRRLLAVIRSFGARGATQREIDLRAARIAGPIRRRDDRRRFAPSGSSTATSR